MFLKLEGINCICFLFILLIDENTNSIQIYNNKDFLNDFLSLAGKYVYSFIIIINSTE